MNTILINRKIADGLQIHIENPRFIPHYQGVHTVTDENNVSNNERASIGQNWAANYSGRNNAQNDFAFGTSLIDLHMQGTDAKRIITVGNLYMAPPSYMTERGLSWQASLKYAAEETDEPINHISLVMGDGNTYGMNSAMRGPLNTPAYPITAGIAALTRADINEGDHWREHAQRQGYATDENNIKEPSIKKLGGLVGMRLDHFAAKGVSAHTVDFSPVDFSDHQLLTADVKF